MRKKIKTKTLEYFITHKYQKDGLVESKKHIPDWYKKSKQFLIKNPLTPVTKGLKLCAPFLDAMTTGYMIELTQDIRVAKDQYGKQCFTWTDIEPGGVSVVARETKTEVPVPVGFEDTHLAWLSGYSFKLPKGYSALFTHPLNRTDLPFYTLSGIIDLDQGIHSGAIPFFIKNDFEGIIEAGTPFMQILPFKRENWKRSLNPDLEEVAKKTNHLTSRVFYGWYKKNIWQKKDYS